MTIKKKKKGSRVDNVMIQLQVNAPTVVKTRYRTTSKFQIIPNKFKNVIIQVICGLEGHWWTIVTADSIFGGVGVRGEGLHGQWSVTSAALTFPSSEQMPTCSPLSSRLIWLIFTELWGHIISRHPFLEAANICGGGGRKLHAQPQPTKWTPEMVKSEREMKDSDSTLAAATT